MKTLLITLVLCVSAGACAGTTENYKPPIVDDSQWTAEQKAEYPAALAACQKIANATISDAEYNMALYDSELMYRQTEKRRAVRRACLAGRGFVVLY